MGGVLFDVPANQRLLRIVRSPSLGAIRRMTRGGPWDLEIYNGASARRDGYGFAGLSRGDIQRVVTAFKILNPGLSLVVHMERDDLEYEDGDEYP